MEEKRGPDADALTEQLLGWRLPVSGLSDWIEGRPAPGRPARVERNGSRPVLIEQDGWTVRLAESFETSGRPRLMVLERAASPFAPGVVLRLVVDDPAA
jgi:outer membrane lipoprotein LolB